MRVLLGMVALATVVAVLPLPAGPVVQVGTVAQPSGARPVVHHPAPPPGAVVEAGPVLLTADVRGADPSDVTFLVDGQRANGPYTDPDGQLSGRRGVEVTLAPGPHTIEVAVDGHGTVGGWQVEASGLAADRADAEVLALARRTSSGPVGARPVVVVDPDDHVLTALAATTAAHAGAVLAPAVDGRLTPPVRELLPDAAPASVEVLLVGPTARIPEDTAAELRNLGHPVTRVDQGQPAVLAAALAGWLDGHGPPRAGVLVAPVDVAAQDLLRAASTAAHLGLDLLLAGPGGLPSTAIPRLRAAPTVLVASSLGERRRAQVVRILGPDAVVSDHDLLAGRASEALLVADDVPAAVAALAVRGAGPDRVVVHGDTEARSWVAAHGPDRVTVVGDEHGLLADGLHRDWVDGPDAPHVEALIDPTDGLLLTLTADVPLASAQVHVDLLGFQWPGDTVVEGERVTWTGGPRPRLPEALEPTREATPLPVGVTAVVAAAGGGSRHVSLASTVAVDPVASVSREGFLVAGGASRVVGQGPVRTFTVEVERATGLDLLEVTEEVEEILLDPRGWTADGTRSLQRIASSQAADLRVVLARPAIVDHYCGLAGLSTGGRVSCWDGYRAMLNLDRWTTAVPHFRGDIRLYREYLVNHEVGHGLGYGHVGCPAPGALAPVMVQQTGGLGGCRANGWPYPTFGLTPATG